MSPSKLIGLMLVGAASALHAQDCDVIGWDTSLGWGYGALQSGEHIDAMVVYDDGNGPALYAAGNFRDIGGTVAWSIARFNADLKRWEALAAGLRETTSSPGVVYDLEVFDFDGAGPEAPKLVVAGDFLRANDTLTVNNIATWDGTDWAPLSGGFTSALDSMTEVRALEVYDDGNGPRLYAGGIFGFAGGSSIAAWNGSAWQSVGSGLLNGYCYALKSHDDGSGEKLYIGGNVPAYNNFAAWDGTSIAAVPGGARIDVSEFEVWDDDGAGPADAALFAYGYGELTRWDGVSQTTIASLGGVRTDALALHDDGTGEALYMGPNNVLGGTSRLHKWDGTTLTTIGPAFSGNTDGTAVAYSMVSFDDGDGPSLWVGGFFVGVGDLQSNGIVKWEGSAWDTVLPTGGVSRATDLSTTFSANPADVDDAVVFDPDGAGPLNEALFFAGNFEFAGGVGAPGTAKWDGSSWAGVGLGSAMPENAQRGNLTIFNDGGGDALYMTGQFNTTPGGFNGVFRLDTETDTWLQIGGDFTLDTIDNYFTQIDLAVYDDGSGEALYASGSFNLINGTPVNSFAKWDGSQWNQVGSGLGSALSAYMEPFDDGAGEKLFIRGNFSSAGGVTTTGLATWDGAFNDASAGLTSVPSAGATGVTGNGPLFVVKSGSSYRQWDSSTQTWDALAEEPPSHRTLSILPSSSTTSADRIWFTLLRVRGDARIALVSYDGQTWTTHDDLGLIDSFSRVCSWDGGPMGPALWFVGGGTSVDGQEIHRKYAVNGTPAHAIIPLLCEAGACPADLNGDGILDLIDINLFVTGFLAGDLIADLSGDGILDLVDVNLFVASFLAGCP